MRRIPIYQMTFGQDQSGKPGLVFTSEQKEYGSQSILFAIPIIESFHHPFDLIESIEHQAIYFPFQMGEKYYELEAKINFPELTFSVPDTDIQISFEIDIDSFSNWYYFPFRKDLYKKKKYIGKANNLILKNNGFLTLMPVDLFEMDELYLKHNGIFVGLTPNFGQIENIDKQ
jgi:hypothetical protein